MGVTGVLGENEILLHPASMRLKAYATSSMCVHLFCTYTIQ